MARKEIASYSLGDIKVVITETEKKDKLLVDCSDGHYHSSFTASPYEFKNYKRHMNQRIKNAFNGQYEE